jgi:hypothetical protein
MPSSSDAPESAPVEPPASSRRTRTCSGRRPSEVLAQLRVGRDRRHPAFDTSGGLEARDGCYEVAAREVVRRREGLAVGAVRLLLGHGGQAPRTARDDAPEGSRLAPELPRDDGAIVHLATVPGERLSARGGAATRRCPSR